MRTHTHKGIKSFPSCSLERKICVSYTHLNCGSHLIIMKRWWFYPRYATEICTFEFFKYTEVVKTLKAEVVYNEWSECPQLQGSQVPVDFSCSHQNALCTFRHTGGISIFLKYFQRRSVVKFPFTAVLRHGFWLLLLCLCRFFVDFGGTADPVITDKPDFN